MPNAFFALILQVGSLLKATSSAVSGSLTLDTSRGCLVSKSCSQEQILGISGQSRKDLVHHNNTCSSSDSYIFFHMERKFWRQVTGLGSLMEVGGGGLFRHPWGTTGTRRTLSAALNPPYFTLLLDSRNAPVPKPQTPRGLPHVSSWALFSH